MNNLAVYTTVYPGVERYLGAWAHSVRQQTDDHFDLWIGIDSLRVDQVRAAIGKDLLPNCVMASDGDSPTQIRIKAIKELAESYSAVVFVDSDDVLDPSRVEAARTSLEHVDVVACALRIIDENGQDLGLTFGSDMGKAVASLLPRYNIFGLSNTAYRSDVLRRCLPLSDESELVDWQLATRAWMLGAELAFDPTPRMFYRQYSSNVARVLQPFSNHHVAGAAAKVLDHYHCLLSGTKGVPERHRDELMAARGRAEKFYQSICLTETLERYVNALNRLTPEYVWWWCVAHPDLESIWKN